MNYLDAAQAILQHAGQSLRYEEITERALAQGILSPQGLTPEATMASRLYTDTLQEGSRFVRAGKGVFGLADWRPGGIDEEVRRINQTARDRLRELLLAMPPERFESLIGELLIQMGFDESTVNVTKRTGDGGIDVMGVYRAAGLTEVNAAVQVKRWKHNVQQPTVTQLRGSLQVYQQGIIITTSGFSKGARTEATASTKTHIGLINGNELLDLLIKHRVGVVEKPLTVIAIDEDWWGELISPAKPALPEPKAEANSLKKEPLPDLGETQPKGKKALGEKPPKFMLFGESHTAGTWRGLLMTVCEVVAQRHPDDFAAKAVTVKGRTRQQIAESPDGMINPLPIANTGLWLEANQSRRSALRVVELVLAAFGYQSDEFHLS